MGYPVNPPTERALDTYPKGWEVAAASTVTRQTELFPSGAALVRIGCSRNGANAPTTRGIFVVFDALNDIDAAQRLLNPTSCFYVPMDSGVLPFGFDDTSLAKRMDWIGDVISANGEVNGFRVNATVGMPL